MLLGWSDLGTDCRELFNRQGFPRQKQLDPFFQIRVPRLQNIGRTLESTCDYVAHGYINLARGCLGSFNAIGWKAGKKRLRLPRIGSLADLVVHSMTRNHLEGDFRGALEIVSGTR